MRTEFVVDFPTLGYLKADWVEQHCVVLDDEARPRSFVEVDWQLWCSANHYRVRPDAERGQKATAFHYRRSQVVAPQKVGKGPWSATIVAFEAAGPSLFAGWARGGEVYRCRDYGCGCGWEYAYEPGEPMGRPWVDPLIQITATAEDQTDNVFRPLQAMLRRGPLAEVMRVGEEFIRVGDEGRIDVVTSSATARLGQPLTFAIQDETGLWTKQNKMLKIGDTQRRGAAGMGGRTMETTNAWDPAEQSYAQLTAQSTVEDIFRFHRLPPATLSYRNKVERARIHRYVYDGSWWVDLEAIEAEALELLERDPEQAERFFGNRIVQGKGSWLKDGRWDDAKAPVGQPPDGTMICLGFDGSETDDWTAIRAETVDGYQFTPTFGPDRKPTWWNPAEHGGQIPRGQVETAVDELHTRFQVGRFYCDPRDWQTDIGRWALEHGTAVEWPTNQINRTWMALERVVTDLGTGQLTHDGDKMTADHVANARKAPKPGQKYVLEKPAGAHHQKIDLAMASMLAHEARVDAVEDGWGQAEPTAYAYFA
jgi:hypothetical protein